MLLWLVNLDLGGTDAGAGAGVASDEVLSCVVQAAMNTSTGDQVFAHATETFTAKAAIFFLTSATVNGTIAADALLGIGAASSSSDMVAQGVFAEDGSTTGNRVILDEVNNQVVNVPLISGTLDVTATLKDFNLSGGKTACTLTIGNAPAGAYLLTVVFFGGADLQAHANDFLMGFGTSAIPITAPGFDATDVFCWHDNVAIPGAGGTNYFFGTGWASNLEGTPVERSMMISETGEATSAPWLAFSDDCCAARPETGGSFTWKGNITALTNGFNFTPSASANNRSLAYIAFDFGNAELKVDTYDTPTTAIEDTTVVNFTPGFVMMGMTGVSNTNTVNQSSAGSIIGYHVADGTDEYSVANSIQDGQTTYVCKSSTNNALKLIADDGSTILHAATTTFNANDFALDFTTAHSTSRKWWYAALQQGTQSATGRIMSSLVNYGGLAGHGGLAGKGGGLAG